MIAELCTAGDARVEARLAKIFVQDATIEKGQAYPTTVSVNECCYNNTPLATDPAALQPGDLVKINVGVHVDGYIAYAAHTITLPSPDVAGPAAADASSDGNSEGSGGVASPGQRRGEVLAAVRDAAFLASTLIRPGVNSETVVKGIQRVVCHLSLP